VSEVDSPAPFIVRIRTRRPTRVLPNKLHFALVVPEGSTRASLDAKPDGTGPYAIESWEKNDVKLRRNDHYWREAPPIPRARFLLKLPAGQAADGLASGSIHLAQASGELQARASELPRHTQLWHENIYVKYLTFDLSREKTPYVNLERNPFRDARVRRAIHLGLDRDALVAALANRPAPASQPVRRFIFGFDPELPVPRPDRERARALLEQAGLGNGFDGVMHARDLFADAGRIVVQQLATLGIRFRLEVVPDAEHFARMRRRDESIWLTRYGCPTGDASDILENVIHSVQPDRVLGNQNDAGFADPEVDRLIEETVVQEATADRQAAMQRALRATMEALPLVPLYTDQDLYLLDERFQWQPRNDSYIRLSEVTPAVN
jgi:peptide/nickel transport system substrate-binding protein